MRHFTFALIASALLFWFGTGLDPEWLLTWLAPVPVLLVAPRVPRAQAAGLALLAWFLGGLNMWSFFRVLELPAAVALGAVALPAVVFAGAVLLYRALFLRGAYAWAVLALPAGWVSFEYALCLGSPHGTYGNLAYTQMDLLPLVQLASVTGVWGLSFVALLVPCLLAGFVEGRASRLLALVAAVVATLGWGVFRMSAAPASPGAVPVALGAIDGAPGNPPIPRDGRAVPILQAYAAQVDALAESGATVIVFPEKIARLTDTSRDSVLALFGAAARRAGVTLVVGLQDTGPPQDRNVALAFAPDGRLAGTYVKHHLIPHFEGENASGTEMLLLDEHPDWGVQICKDLDFPELSRRYSRAGARLMLVPAWDFVSDGWLHSRMAVMRGVEGGFTVVRAARNGLLTTSDDRGRVFQQVESRPSFVQAALSVPLGSGPTFYTRHGDWFAWACVLLLGGALLGLLRRGRDQPA